MNEQTQKEIYKKTLLRFLRIIAGKIPLPTLIEASGMRLFSPFYHSVGSARTLPHICHLYPIRDAKQFEAELDFLLKYFEPFSLEDLLQQAENQDERSRNKNRFFLSFDDGLREVFDIAAPILKRKGVPVTIFLNSAFVDNKGLFFRYKASLLVNALKKRPPSEGEIAALEKLFSWESFSFSQNPTNVLELQAALLAVNYQNQDLLEEAAALLEVDFEAFLKKQQPYLSTQQILALSKDGFTFGGHSIDHPRYSALPFEQQLRQTKSSVDFAKEKSRSSIKAFSFPFTDHRISKKFFEQASAENIFDVSFGTAGLKLDAFPFHFQRFPMEENHWNARQSIHTEYLYFLLKRMVGKHKMRRY